MRIARLSFLALNAVALLLGQTNAKPAIPRTRDENSLRDWATPVAGLNVRPTHISAREFYAIPEQNLRTYPVYLPEREPSGYLGDVVKHRS